jgi:acetone carboxylase gamma subunit
MSYEHRDLVAAVLKEHQPNTDNEKRVHRCACGLEFHFVDARAWHRHAAAMVLGALNEVE